MKHSKSLLLATVVFFICNTSKAQVSEISPAMDKIAAVMQYINYYYVDSVKQEKLTEDAINGVLKELDPHSVYISKKELNAMNEPLQGNFDGIGVQFNILHDTITVVAAIPGGPSEKLGIQGGDKIILIETENVAGKKVKNEDVMKKLRGPKGTKVKVSIKRSGTKDLIDFTITRDKIPLYSIDATYMATPTIGYIKLSRFARTSMDEFRESLKTLKDKGAKDLILDLTDNGGGYLDIAFELSDQFLEDKKLIVYTQGVKSPRKEYVSTSKGEFEKGRVVVMINEGSASASEILAGAVQDWDRGLVIGRRSFGKGLVQNQFSLPDGAAMRLTIARYYTPVGRNIQKAYAGGEEGSDNYDKDLANRYKHGEFFSADSIKFPDSLKFYTPNKRLVYGGGGIMPDLFVPLDTSHTSAYYSKIIRKGILNQFCLSYVDRNRKKINTTYPTFEDYKKNFNVDVVLINELMKEAEKQGIKRDETDFEKVKDIAKVQIRAIIAGDLYKRDNSTEIFNELNDIYTKAIQVLQDDTFKKMKINN